MVSAATKGQLPFSTPIKLRLRATDGISFRYEEVDAEGVFLPNQDEGVVGRFYIHKWALGDVEPPQRLSIFIVKD